MDRSNCANPMTACGLRDFEVNAIMEANVAAWLVRRGLPKAEPKRPRWPAAHRSEAVRQHYRDAALAREARKRSARAA